MTWVHGSSSRATAHITHPNENTSAAGPHGLRAEVTARLRLWHWMSCLEKQEAGSLVGASRLRAPVLEGFLGEIPRVLVWERARPVERLLLRPAAERPRQAEVSHLSCPVVRHEDVAARHVAMENLLMAAADVGLDSCDGKSLAPLFFEGRDRS